MPTVLSVRRLPNADPAMIRAYGGDPERNLNFRTALTRDSRHRLYLLHFGTAEYA